MRLGLFGGRKTSFGFFCCRRCFLGLGLIWFVVRPACACRKRACRASGVLSAIFSGSGGLGLRFRGFFCAGGWLSFSSDAESDTTALERCLRFRDAFMGVATFSDEPLGPAAPGMGGSSIAMAE